MNRSARALSGRPRRPHRRDPADGARQVLSRILWGASEALYEHDMRVVLCPTMHERERQVTLLERLLQGTTDGALLLLTRESSDALTALERRGIRSSSSILASRSTSGRRSLSAGHLAGAKAATEHLLSLGHRRIGVITGPHGWVASVQRLDGYQVSLAAAGVPSDPRLIAKGNFHERERLRSGNGVAEPRNPPTAIFAFNDEMAVGAMRAAEERGLQIPRDLSIVGFDKLEKTQIVTPALTTVRQPRGDGANGGQPAHAAPRGSADRSDARRPRDEAGRASRRRRRATSGELDQSAQVLFLDSCVPRSGFGCDRDWCGRRSRRPVARTGSAPRLGCDVLHRCVHGRRDDWPNPRLA